MLPASIHVHGSNRRSAGCIAAATRARSEGVLYGFHDWIKLTLPLDRIYESEAVDDAALAAEHHLLVKDFVMFSPESTNHVWPRGSVS